MEGDQLTLEDDWCCERWDGEEEEGGEEQEDVGMHDGEGWRGFWWIEFGLGWGGDIVDGGWRVWLVEVLEGEGKSVCTYIYFMCPSKP